MTPATILVVDDERAVRELVSAALARAGFAVKSAASAEEALVIQGASPAQVLVTDVMLPLMNGPELAREIRRRSPHTRVLFMSGYAGNSSLSSADLDDASAFLQKPFGATAIVARVRELLDPSGS